MKTYEGEMEAVYDALLEKYEKVFGHMFVWTKNPAIDFEFSDEGGVDCIQSKDGLVELLVEDTGKAGRSKWKYIVCAVFPDGPDNDQEFQNLGDAVNAFLTTQIAMRIAI